MKTPIVFFIILIICYSKLDSQIPNYYIEEYSYKDNFEDTYIIDLTISPRGNLFVVTRREILEFRNGEFKVVLDISDHKRVREIAIDKWNRLWVVYVQKRIDDLSDNLKVYDIDTFEEIKNIKERIEGIDLMESDWLRNIIVDVNHDIFLHIGFNTAYKLNNINQPKGDQKWGLVKYLKKIEVEPKIMVDPGKEVTYGSSTPFEPRLNRFLSSNFTKKDKFITVDKDKNLNDATPFIDKNIADVRSLFVDFGYPRNISFTDKYYYFYDQEHLVEVDQEFENAYFISSVFESHFKNKIINKCKAWNKTIWIGTNNGLLRVERNERKFIPILNGEGNAARSILPINDEEMLLGTSKGLFIYNNKTNNYTKLSKHNVYSLTPINSKEILVGGHTHNLNILSPKKTRYKDPSSISVKKLHELKYPMVNGFKLNDTQILITQLDSVATLNLRTNKIEYFEDHHDNINYTSIVALGDSIYALGERGLSHIDVYKNNLRRSNKFSALEAFNISMMYQDNKEDGIYWICTKGDGLIKYNSNKKTIDKFGIENGLLSLNVHSFHKDTQGRIWLSTDYGISILNERTGDIVTITNLDGLPENEMNRHSFYLFPDSTLMYGTIDGLIKFKPNEFEINFEEGFADLQYLQYKDKYSQKVETVLISNDDNTITLKENYINPTIKVSTENGMGVYNIRYLLDASNNSGWKRTENGLIDLAPDTWNKSTNLLVSYRRNLSDWSAPQAIKLEKIKPIYREPIFYITLLISGLLILFGWSSLARVRALRINKEIEQKVKEQTFILSRKNQELIKSNELNEKLFSIIGHDLKAPITSFVNLNKNFRFLLERSEYNNLEKLNRALEANSVKMLSVVDRLLEWSSSIKEQSIEKSSIHISDIFQTIVNDLSQLISTKAIKIEMKTLSQVPIYNERESLTIILRNLLSNAIKYSDQYSTITLTYDGNKISVMDQGKGLSDKQVIEFNQGKRIKSSLGTEGEKGLGLGLEICKDVAERCSLRIVAKKNTPSGTIFSIVGLEPIII